MTGAPDVDVLVWCSIHAGDFNQDGFADAFLCRSGTSALYINLASVGGFVSGFEDRTTSVLPSAPVGCTGALWLDTDLDADLVSS
jgi:hypothetical protein